MDSDDIKRALVAHFNAQGIATQASQWKRLSKKKDAQGRPVREFSCESVGVVQVVQDNADLIISQGASPALPGSSQVSASGFTLPEFSDESRRAAARVHAVFLEIAQGEGDYEDLDLDAAEEIRKHPEFAAALPALGTRLAFMFPAQTYGNDEMDPATTLDSPVGELCVSILDPDPDAEHDLYAWGLLVDGIPAAGLDSMDEYHFEFNDKKQTVRQAIQRLLDIGLSYNVRAAADKDEGCVFYAKLKNLIPKRPKLSSQSSGPGNGAHQAQSVAAPTVIKNVATSNKDVPLVAFDLFGLFPPDMGLTSEALMEVMGGDFNPASTADVRTQFRAQFSGNIICGLSEVDEETIYFNLGFEEKDGSVYDMGSLAHAYILELLFPEYLDVLSPDESEDTHSIEAPSRRAVGKITDLIEERLEEIGGTHWCGPGQCAPPAQPVLLPATHAIFKPRPLTYPASIASLVQSTALGGKELIALDWDNLTAAQQKNIQVSAVSQGFRLAKMEPGYAQHLSQGDLDPGACAHEGFAIAQGGALLPALLAAPMLSGIPLPKKSSTPKPPRGFA